MQFTKNATLYAVVGELVLYCFLQDGHKKDLFLGFLLVSAGIVTRDECFLFTLPFIGALLLVDFIQKKIDAIYLKNLVPVTLSVVGIYLISFGVHHYFYTQNNWAEFQEFNKYRTVLLDYNNHVSYEEYEDAFLEKGITKNMYELMNTWDYGDTEVYTTQFMIDAAAIQQQHYQRISRVPQMLWLFVRHMGNLLFQRNLYAFLLVALYGYLVIKKKKDFLLLAIAFAGVFFLEYMYLYYLGRIMWRAEIGIWLFPIVFLVQFLKQDFNHFNEKSIKKILIGTTVLELITLGIELPRAQGVKQFWRENNHLAFYQEIQKDYPNTYYAADVMTFFPKKHVPDPLSITTKYAGLFQNFQEIGSWHIPSPTGEYYFYEAGIRNPVKALVEGERVLFVCNDAHVLELMENFLNEVYQKDIHFTKVDTIADMNIYKAEN
ncbi:MAG: hypothetical protein J6D29_01085 [Solobacterium sp.]|nr:hypothetical protein [Solobacterium sp.]